MPTPAQLQDAAASNEAGRLLSHLEGLEKTPGWTDYLCPKIFAAYDAAAERILRAHASGQSPAGPDIATLQGYHELVTTVRSERSRATSRLSGGRSKHS